jgi:hypothetical protein
MEVGEGNLVSAEIAIECLFRDWTFKLGRIDIMRYSTSVNVW